MKNCLLFFFIPQQASFRSAVGIPAAPASDLSSWGSSSSETSGTKANPGAAAAQIKSSKGVLDLSKFLNSSVDEDKAETEPESSKLIKEQSPKLKEEEEEPVNQKEEEVPPETHGEKEQTPVPKKNEDVSDWGSDSSDMLKDNGGTAAAAPGPTKETKQPEKQSPFKQISPKVPLKSLSPVKVLEKSPAKSVPKSPPVIQRLEESDEESSGWDDDDGGDMLPGSGGYDPSPSSKKEKVGVAPPSDKCGSNLDKNDSSKSLEKKAAKPAVIKPVETNKSGSEWSDSDAGAEKLLEEKQIAKENLAGRLGSDEPRELKSKESLKDQQTSQSELQGNQLTKDSREHDKVDTCKKSASDAPNGKPKENIKEQKKEKVIEDPKGKVPKKEDQHKQKPGEGHKDQSGKAGPKEFKPENNTKSNQQDKPKDFGALEAPDNCKGKDKKTQQSETTSTVKVTEEKREADTKPPDSSDSEWDDSEGSIDLLPPGSKQTTTSNTGDKAKCEPELIAKAGKPSGNEKPVAQTPILTEFKGEETKNIIDPLPTEKPESKEEKPLNHPEKKLDVKEESSGWDDSDQDLPAQKEAATKSSSPSRKKDEILAGEKDVKAKSPSSQKKGETLAKATPKESKTSPEEDDVKNETDFGASLGKSKKRRGSKSLLSRMQDDSDSDSDWDKEVEQRPVRRRASRSSSKTKKKDKDSKIQNIKDNMGKKQDLTDDGMIQSDIKTEIKPGEKSGNEAEIQQQQQQHQQQLDKPKADPKVVKSLKPLEKEKAPKPSSLGNTSSKTGKKQEANLKPVKEANNKPETNLKPLKQASGKQLANLKPLKEASGKSEASNLKPLTDASVKTKVNQKSPKGASEKAPEDLPLDKKSSKSEKKQETNLKPVEEANSKAEADAKPSQEASGKPKANLKTLKETSVKPEANLKPLKDVSAKPEANLKPLKEASAKPEAGLKPLKKGAAVP